MNTLSNKKILLGICGGVAAYKSAYLIRELISLGAHVRAVMTQSAQQFITPLQIQALGCIDVRSEMFDPQAERAMSHIELARWADFLLISPASANCLSKMAQGIADDLLSTLYLVAEVPVIVCPAMNKSMWNHPATVANCKLLKERRVVFIGPEEGLQACGEYGFGRMSDVEEMIKALRFYDLSQLLVGKRIIITAGPTREAIDPVRYLSNYSSGKMGYALAQAALRAHAEVLLISGPSSIKSPTGIELIRVESAQSMMAAVMSRLQKDTVFIGAAAVADYRINNIAKNKIKKNGQTELSLKLVKNEDILSAVVASAKASYVVGFAAETQNVLANAREKLKQKKLDMIVANKVGLGLGFECDCNEVIVLTKNKQIDLSLKNKMDLAEEIIAILAENLQNDGHQMQ